MRFAKLQGLGNDFIVVDSSAVPPGAISGLARRICDRHFGVGADGLLLWQRHSNSNPAVFRMRIFNADGGEAELSGNGLRCLAAYLYHQGIVAHDEVQIDTLAGRKWLRLVRSAGLEYWFDVEMGRPILDRKQIAFRPGTEPSSLTACELPVGDAVYSVTITSMGNPHCSLFLDEFQSLDWEALGRQIEVHPYFPNRTNVEFIRVVNRGEIEVRFWERGVGKTFSSGTGSCAAAVASILNGYTDRRAKVRTLGGDLDIRWDDDEILWLQGPATLICQGEYFSSIELRPDR
jgi:diaminopimelate epimerase